MLQCASHVEDVSKKCPKDSKRNRRRWIHWMSDFVQSGASVLLPLKQACATIDQYVSSMFLLEQPWASVSRLTNINAGGPSKATWCNMKMHPHLSMPCERTKKRLQYSAYSSRHEEHEKERHQFQATGHRMKNKALHLCACDRIIPCRGCLVRKPLLRRDSIGQNQWSKNIQTFQTWWIQL